MTRSPRSWWTTALSGLGVASLLASALLASALVPAVSAVAAPAPSSSPAALTPLVCDDHYAPDFERDGLMDIAVGVPSEDRGSVAGAGAVEIGHPCSNRPAQFLALPGAHAHDGFGSAVVVGLGGYYSDLVVGVPGLDVGGHRDAGGVAFFYGSAQGLRYGKTLTQASPSVGGSVQAGARFGQTLSITDDDYSGATLLRIGEPGRTVSGKVGAGGVVDYVLKGGLSKARSGEITLASKGVPGSPQAGDAMGAAISSGRFIGLPNRTVNGAKAAGAVVSTPYRPGEAYRLLTQDSPGVPGTPEAGDHFGASIAGGWVGAPGESVDGVAGAGVVITPFPFRDRPNVLNQHDADPTEVVEAGDHFGAAMTEVGWEDAATFRARLLLVGAPGEDVAARANAGTVSVIAEDDGEDGSASVGPSYGGLQPAAVVAGARFGAVLGRLGQQTVQVGAPSARGGRLSLFVVARGQEELPTLSVTQAQTAGTPETGDRYGDAVVVSEY
jgi:hypothetical protein